MTIDELIYELELVRGRHELGGSAEVELPVRGDQSVGGVSVCWTGEVVIW